MEKKNKKKYNKNEYDIPQNQALPQEISGIYGTDYWIQACQPGQYPDVQEFQIQQPQVELHPESQLQPSPQELEVRQRAINQVKQQFHQLRSHRSIPSALEQMNEFSIDIKTLTQEELNQELTKVCFVVVNTYTKAQYSLGVGPLNDAITAGINHFNLGYTVYYLHNGKAREFMNYLSILLQNTTDNLSVYYTGHGVNVRDRNNDESDGKDEAMLFDDTYIVDDELAALISKTKPTLHVLLMNDCCHSGTIWDIPTNPARAATFPPNIISISAAADDQTAKQGKRQNIEQGFFTYHFFRAVCKNKKITPNQIKQTIAQPLRQFQQSVMIVPTRPELLNQPMLSAD